MESIFETVKAGVSVPQAAQAYGLEVRKGMAKCPFYPDRHPSMLVREDHYHCFGCGAHGDVIALTAWLYALPPLEAARKLAFDFGISSDSLPSRRTAPNPVLRQRSLEEPCLQAVRRYARTLESEVHSHVRGAAFSE